MKIIRAKDYKDMSRKAANIISAQVIMKPNCVLGLATGGTPVGAYAQLVDWYNKGDIDFSEVTTVNLDEYRGLPKEHPESYWSFMHRNLFDKVNIDPAKINLPDGTNPDAEDACAKYNQIIHAVGGIDLQLLGIGHDGHIGFNEPGEAFELETHCVNLTPATIVLACATYGCSCCRCCSDRLRRLCFFFCLYRCRLCCIFHRCCPVRQRCYRWFHLHEERHRCPDRRLC